MPWLIAAFLLALLVALLRTAPTCVQWEHRPVPAIRPGYVATVCTATRSRWVWE